MALRTLLLSKDCFDGSLNISLVIGLSRCGIDMLSKTTSQPCDEPTHQASAKCWKSFFMYIFFPWETEEAESTVVNLLWATRKHEQWKLRVGCVIWGRGVRFCGEVPRRTNGFKAKDIRESMVSQDHL